MGTSHDLRSALTRAMTAAVVNKVVNMTVSRTKQLPTWSTWLSDWATSDARAVRVQTLTALPEEPVSQELQRTHSEILADQHQREWHSEPG